MAALVNTIYLGKLDDMIAEVATIDPRGDHMSDAECVWAVQPVGDYQFDANYCRTREEAVTCARDLAAIYCCDILSL